MYNLISLIFISIRFSGISNADKEKIELISGSFYYVVSYQKFIFCLLFDVM